MTLKVLVAVVLVACGDTKPSGRESDPNLTTGAVPQAGSVLGPEEGERLLRCAGGGWLIKVDPENAGSMRLAMGTQDMPPGSAIPVHRHENEDEILFVHRGHAVGIVGDDTLLVESGATMYVPKGTWHGVHNHTDSLARILWIVSPPGLERFFRDIGARPGTDCPPRTREEILEIEWKHGVVSRVP